MSEKPARFITRERVAEGRTVVVSRALDNDTGRDVALKALRDDHSTFPDRVAAFSSASKLAARLFSTHLVPVIAARRVGQRIFTVSPWIAGVRLSDLPLPLPPDLVAGILAQMAEGMNVAHGTGVLLRGINPRDIRIRPDGTVLLTDLNKVQEPGPCHGLPPQGAARAEILRYLPMEARSNGSVDARTDIFALGALALELLTGVPPTREGAVDMKPALVQALTSQGPLGQLSKLAMALASPRPDQRPSSVVSLAPQLQSILGAPNPKAAVQAHLQRLAPNLPRPTPLLNPAVSAPPRTPTPAPPAAPSSSPPAPPAPAPAWAAAPTRPVMPTVNATAPDEVELMELLEETTNPLELEQVKAAVEGDPTATVPEKDPWGLRSAGRFRSLENEVSSDGDQSGFAYLNDSGRTVLGQPAPNLERTKTQARGLPAVRTPTQPGAPVSPSAPSTPPPQPAPASTQAAARSNPPLAAKPSVGLHTSTRPPQAVTPAPAPLPRAPTVKR